MEQFKIYNDNHFFAATDQSWFTHLALSTAVWSFNAGLIFSHDVKRVTSVQPTGLPFNEHLWSLLDVCCLVGVSEKH